MHELSIAQRLVDRAVTVAQEHGAATVNELTVAVGRATHLNPDQLRFCVEAVATDTAVSDAAITFERVPVRGECDCGWTGEPGTVEQALTYVPDPTCPDCGDRITITEGRGCHLTRIDIPDATAETTAPRPDSQ
jgi:hydrogenase nickel incorporation protein HypA/HybF